MKKSQECIPLKIAKGVEIITDDLKDEIDECKKLFPLIPEEELLRFTLQSDLFCNYALAKWVQNKQIYSFTQDFVDILKMSDMDFPIDKNVFEKLPYDTFMIKVEDKYDIIHYNKDDIFPDKAFFTIVSFPKEKNYGLGYPITLQVSKYQGISVDIAKSVEDSQSVAQNSEINECAKETARMLSPEHINEISQIVLYMSAKNAVIEENAEQKKIYRPPFDKEHPKNRYSELRMWDCGVRYAKDKVAAIKKDYEYSSEHKHSGSKKRPHWRRGHYHRFRCGEGKKDITINWVEPTFVGGKDYDELPAVVHLQNPDAKNPDNQELDIETIRNRIIAENQSNKNIKDIPDEAEMPDPEEREPEDDSISEDISESR